MQYILQSNDLNAYLRDTEPVSFSTPLVRALAKTFEAGGQTQLEKARSIYECVRDRFPHSADIGAEKVSVTAEDVVRKGHGICYAKSHLLAALMRSAGIPAGFCYQLTILDDETAPYLVVHALNAIFLDAEGSVGRWVRLDAR